jgi:polysaccharide export outer membrane protein
MIRVVFGFVCIFIALAVGGCSVLPRSGPAHEEIIASATAGVEPAAVGEPLKYAIVDVTAEVAKAIPDVGVGSFLTSFGDGYRPSPNIRVSVGDQLQVTIFESTEGGLFIPANAGARPGNYVTLPAQIIDKSGEITVPYAGQIHAVGRSTADIQREIVKLLESRAIQPQVVVSFLNRASTVSVVGEVRAPAKLDLNFNGDKVLDLIARAGGPVTAGWDTYVTLQRSGKEATNYFNTLVNHPRENIFVRPGDTIYVYHDYRFFTAFGASAAPGRYAFDAERVYLSDAMGRAGGLLDNRADPEMVFVYRLEGRAVLKTIGVDLSGFPDNETRIPTVYKVNLKDPRTFFLTEKFPMRNHDVIYVSNSPQTEIVKFLDLVNSAAITLDDVAVGAGNVPIYANAAKNAIKDLAH